MAKASHEDDVAFVKALAEVLRANDLTDLEVKREYAEDSTLTVRVSRRQQKIVQNVSSSPMASGGAAPAVPAQSAQAAPSVEMSDDPADHPGAVTSPMVGTCYLQAEPGTPAFVSVGDKVSEGQTLLIIEAMKTMNHIPAPRSGTVKRILVDDGTPVEFGAPLMIVE